MLVDFLESIVVAGLVTTLFLGGWQVPFLMRDGLHLPGDIFYPLPSLLVTLVQLGAFVITLVFFCWLQIMIRWTLPGFRYDQLINLGWKILLPLALANVLVTALFILIFQAK